ncbi:MAG: S41 family peptidase, partial [Defluviitaleaceae bacterium]|nr:S41 family peptidase [Defluviitaleaceae bacterium]
YLPSRFLYDQLQDERLGSQRNCEKPVYETHILSDGIALLSVSSMLHLDNAPTRAPGYQHMDYYAALLYDFWYEIIDFDHLIIDLRGNPGGHLCHFSKYIASMLVTSRMWLPLYVFFGDGHYSNIGRNAGGQQIGGHIFVWPQPVFDADPGDLDFVFRSAFSWVPASFYRAWGYAFFAGHQGPFVGKVWVLTDEQTASGAEAVTAMLLLNDLATVVGYPTRGIFGTGFEREAIEFALPNTGIIIRIDTALYKCHEGNILQGYGLQPHYAPREGMDALETVLAMIAEGAELTCCAG